MGRIVARWVLDAVEEWATGCRLVRETEIGMGPGCRIDGLLVPVGHRAFCMQAPFGRCEPASSRAFFDRPRLIGVEVKVDRSDFLNGLKRVQFTTYRDDSQLAGLYVATPKGLIRTKELPDGVGHLVIREAPPRNRRRQFTAVCRRRPELSDVTPDAETAWRLLFKLTEASQRHVVEANTRVRDIETRMGHILGKRIMGAVVKLEREAEPDRAGRVKGER